MNNRIVVVNAILSPFTPVQWSVEASSVMAAGCKCMTRASQGERFDTRSEALRRETVSTKFYAVGRGRSTGLYRSWAEAKEQVIRVKGAEHKAFGTLSEAIQYLES